MTLKLKFDSDTPGHMSMYVPHHTQETLELYVIHGLRPGGFISAMLALDMSRALYNADTANRQMMWAIGRWIMDEAPHGSWGSYEAVQEWIDDVGGRRTAFVTELEKQYIAEVLAKP